MFIPYEKFQNFKAKMQKYIFPQREKLKDKRGEVVIRAGKEVRKFFQRKWRCVFIWRVVRIS